MAIKRSRKKREEEKHKTALNGAKALPVFDYFACLCLSLLSLPLSLFSSLSLLSLPLSLLSLFLSHFSLSFSFSLPSLTSPQASPCCLDVAFCQAHRAQSN